jgi:hypothetical protein
MWFHSLLASWKSRRSRGRRPQPARRGARLILQHLEDRALPSSYTAYTAADPKGNTASSGARYDDIVGPYART